MNTVRIADCFDTPAATPVTRRAPAIAVDPACGPAAAVNDGRFHRLESSLHFEPSSASERTLCAVFAVLACVGVFVTVLALFRPVVA